MRAEKWVRAALFAQTVVSLVALGATGNAVSTLDDIHYWVGEGTNRCGVVVDWSAGYGDGTLAWGYRWNGVCTNLAEVLVRIGREDSRLKVCVQGMTSSYMDFYFFGYDVNDNHPQWDEANGAASDSAALVLREDSVSYSAWWVLYGPMAGPGFPTAEQTSSATSANGIVPRDADWFVLRWGCPEYGAGWVEVPTKLPTPTAAESPYGYRVVASSTSATSPHYKDSRNVLGRPTACMDDPSVYWAGQNFGGVVNPANPAWGVGRLFSLESDGDEALEPGEENGPGYVTIAFDHDVVDDPANPFGLDFIVFGNALVSGVDDTYYNPGTDPTKFSFKGISAAEAAKVEVSQDGKTWFSGTDWKPADDFAPTLGHLYDPKSPDPALYDGNRFWGRTTQATRPVDPHAGASNCAGRTLAEVCRFYNGSAGGTGYDISGLDLPKNGQGRKWFRYVRISGVYSDDLGEGDSGYTAPEVDAVADVAPVSGYEKWVEENYTDWTTAWNAAVSGPEVVAANGKPNAVNYFLGLSASEAASAFEFKITAFEPGKTKHRIQVVTNRRLESGCGVVVKRADSLSSHNWVAEVPLVEECAPLEDGKGWVTTLAVSADGGSFFKLALELE